MTDARRGPIAAPSARAFVLINGAPLLAAGSAVGFFLARAWFGLWFTSFNDEVEHLVGGWALSRGDRLYSTFVDLHGPFIFFLAETYGQVFGWAHNNYARLIIVGFAALAAAAIALCPTLTTLRQRAWALTVFVGLVASIWIVDGLYLFENYLVSASLIIVLLAQYVVPAWSDTGVGFGRASLAGACAAFAVFTSHAWLPTIVVLHVSTIVRPGPRMRNGRAAAIVAGSFAAASLICLTWLYRVGSIRGFIVFHVLFAHTIYRQIVPAELTWHSFIVSLLPSFSPDRISQDVGIAALLTVAVVGFRIFPTPSLLLGLLAVLGTDARGKTGFAGGTFVVVAIGLASLTVAEALGRVGRSGWRSLAVSVGALGVIAITECAMRYALSSPGGMTRQMITQQPATILAGQSDAPAFVAIRRLVHPDERMLALVYRPADYWSAGRLPLQGFYAYLPTDALYASHPMLGLRRDLCTALLQHPPPVIIFDDWNVWGRFPPATYMPCLMDTLSRAYTRSVTWPDLYVRNDRAEKR